MLTDNEVQEKFDKLVNKLKAGLYDDVINEASLLLKKSFFILPQKLRLKKLMEIISNMKKINGLKNLTLKVLIMLKKISQKF